MAAGTGIATGFFTSASAGILGALLMAPRRELGRFFSALGAGIAFLLLGLMLPLRVSPLAVLSAGTAVTADMLASLGAALALLLSAAFVTVLYLPGGRGGRGVLPGGRRGRRCLGFATAAAFAATALDGWSAADGGAAGWLFGANALAGAALLGSVIVAMLVGHWYLVRHGLSERHLVRLSIVFAAAVGARATLLLAGLVVYGLGSPVGLERFLESVVIERGLFFWQRVSFGILGPAVFAYMVYETARIRSTQSATGILYLAVVFVVIGEFLARYLAVAGAGPM